MVPWRRGGRTGTLFREEDPEIGAYCRHSSQFYSVNGYCRPPGASLALGRALGQLLPSEGAESGRGMK